MKSTPMKKPFLCRVFGHKYGETMFINAPGLIGEGLYSQSTCKRCNHTEASMTETFPMGTFEIRKKK